MVFDGHSDIFSDVTIRRLAGEQQVLKNRHMDRLRKGGIEGGCFVIWIDPPYDADPPKRLEQILQAVKDEMAECEEAVLVHNAAEIDAAKAAGKFYILPGLEGLSGIGTDLGQIDRLYEFGARHAMLSWNEQNALATGVQGDPERGLTALGKEALKKIQEKHMIVDVSHLNDRSFWDVLHLAEGPILASHSNARALSNAARNLTDEQLLAIRDTNGLVGLNAFNLFVSQNQNEQDLEHFIHHASYIAEKIGVEHLGFGFDFFEFMSTDSMKSYSDQDDSLIRGLEDCSKVPMLLEGLKKAGFTEWELEMIARENWMGLIARTIG